MNPLSKRLAALAATPTLAVTDLLNEAAAAATELESIRETLHGVMHSAFDPDLSTERNLHKHLTSSWS